MAEGVVHIPEHLHKILQAYKKGEGVSLYKQIEFLIKESPRYKGYREASK